MLLEVNFATPCYDCIFLDVRIAKREEPSSKSHSFYETITNITCQHYPVCHKIKALNDNLHEIYISFDNLRTLETIYNKIKEIIDRDKYISVARFNGLFERGFSVMDRKLGWNNINDFYYTRNCHTDTYILKINPPYPIDIEECDDE